MHVQHGRTAEWTAGQDAATPTWFIEVAAVRKEARFRSRYFIFYFLFGYSAHWNANVLRNGLRIPPDFLDLFVNK